MDNIPRDGTASSRDTDSISGDSTAGSSTESTARSRLQAETNMNVEDKKEIDVLKLSAEIIEKTCKWQTFNVQLAVDEYKRRELEIKDLERESSLLIVKIYHLQMELEGKEKH